MRSARMLQGWTQKDLATASKLSQSAIGNYESGLRLRPTGEALIKLTRALRVAPLWLAAGEGPMLAFDPDTVASMLGHAAPGHGRAACAPRGDWPFVSVPYAAYDALSIHEKRQLERVLAAYISARVR
nr:transcriptional regulator [Bordetella genomosp. 5]